MCQRSWLGSVSLSMASTTLARYLALEALNVTRLVRPTLPASITVLYNRGNVTLVKLLTSLTVCVSSNQRNLTDYSTMKPLRKLRHCLTST
jgi:hypothetical protein